MDLIHSNILENKASFKDRINLSGKARRKLYEYIVDVRGNWYTLDFRKMLASIAKNYPPIYKEIYRPQVEPSPEAITLAMIYLLAYQAKKSEDFKGCADPLFQFANDFSEAASEKAKWAMFTRAWTCEQIGISESEAKIIEGVCQNIIKTPVDYMNSKPTDFERETIRGELHGIFPSAIPKVVGVDRIELSTTAL